jgi:hypothetical protein
MSVKLGVTEHTIEMEVSEQETFKQYQFINPVGWGINILEIDDENYSTDLVVYITSNMKTMLPVTISTGSRFSSIEEAIIRTYFSGNNIFGDKVSPEVLVYNTDGDILKEISISDVISSFIENMNSEAEDAMNEKQNATLH